MNKEITKKIVDITVYEYNKVINYSFSRSFISRINKYKTLCSKNIILKVCNKQNN